ncbi:MAG: dienelactone hydrolase family protein [Actinomycetota bacterium]|jgi:dienelactone hydrolase|nr:dienelactone hydrolase family protein [Actinomycetota bacterium]
MDTALQWHEAASDARGIAERPFVVTHTTGDVPGVLWEAADGPPGGSGRPLVLLGHGASGSAREGYIVALAHRLVRARGWRAVAIDGPVHGARPHAHHDPTAAFLAFGQAWAHDAALTDRMVTDWRATIDTLAAVGAAGSGPVGYWGLSMGTIFGVPLVAAEPRIGAAVLGLMGITGPSMARVAHDAQRIRCPVLFLMQGDDELFTRDVVLALFDALGSSDKRLHLHPGGHAGVPAEEFDASERFLAAHLAGGD